MATSAGFSTYTLYYASHSICAIMVRLTYALRGKPKEGLPIMKLVAQEVDIGPKAEQLEEEFLCNVNPEGYVPVLRNDSVMDKPLPESVDITWYLADYYPELLPSVHASEIKRLVNELHRISFYALTFGGMPQHGENLQRKINEILARPGISDRYRKALEYKLFQRRNMEKDIVLDVVASNETKAVNFLAEIDQLKQKYGSGGPFIYGAKPTALDAHVIPFLARLHDKQRTNLIPDKLRADFFDFRDGEIWKSIMPKVSTLPPYLH